MSVHTVHAEHLHAGTGTDADARRFAEPLFQRIGQLLTESTDTAVWRVALARGVDDLGAALWEHRAALEGQSGLLREIEGDAPRLVFAARLTHRELEELATTLAQVRQTISFSMGRPGGVSAVVAATASWLASARRHQERVATLVHDAYELDLGGGD